MSIYLDFNSTTPIDERVLDCMIDVYKHTIGNADSRTHDFGENARQVVENARNQVAHILGVKKDEVFFTSGATESNNIAIQGLKEYGEKNHKMHIVTTSIEHKAVLESAKAMEKLGFEVQFLDPDIDGKISVESVLDAVRDDTLLVSVMHVNNETGIIQPIKEIGDLLSERNVLFHVDATQSFGKLVKELQEVKYNMLSMSAHKIGGPQGIGALILRKQRYKLPPVKAIMYGGQQEHGIRPGTTPVALVAGLGKACELAELEYADDQNKCSEIKRMLNEELEQSRLKYRFNGDQKYCISSTMNLCIEGVASEALMLSSKNYCGVSNGSACNSKSYKPSYVLTAMGIPTEQIENSIRISWGAQESISDIREAYVKLLDVAKQLVW